MTFEAAVEFVLKYEGGYSMDANDPGGETNFGISKRSYPDLDIKNLTREQAIEIYHRDFWSKCRCEELPNDLNLLVFDSAVNQGQPTAIRLLQQSVKTPVDGIIGPATLQATRTTPGVVVEYLARRAYQYAQSKDILHFGLGWYRRLSSAAEMSFKETT